MIDSVHISDSTIYGSSWATPELRVLFTEQAHLRGWLEVMTVLAESQAQFGIIPPQAARDIRAYYDTVKIDDALLQEIGKDYAANNHVLMGVIKAVQARCPPAGGEWLCYGASVQDITDTHTMRVLRTVRQLFISQLYRIEKCLLQLAKQHSQTVMAGRTHGQIGLPITFGYKVATWLDELDRHRHRLLQLAKRMDVVQLAGGVGSLSAFGDKPLAVQSFFAKSLGLNAPLISWTSSRDRYAEWVNALAMLVATTDRIGHEIYNLQRPEIAELSEKSNPKTVSSMTMPQKRNPEMAEQLGTLARSVRHHAAFMNENLVHDHERDGRSWKGEWLIIPESCLATGKALQLLEQILQHLQVNEQRMRYNLELAQGFIFAEAVMLALASKCGKQTAYSIVRELAMRAQENGYTFKTILAADVRICRHFSSTELDNLFSLENRTGACAEMVESLIAAIDLKA